MSAVPLPCDGPRRAALHQVPAPAPDRAALREHLVRSRIAGDVATSRSSNLGNMAKMAAGEPHYQFGMAFAGSWDLPAVLALMVERVGVHPDPLYRSGPDTIDPDLTLAALERMRERLAQAAQRRERVLVATGHPAGVYAIHTEAARALQAAGCALLSPAAGWSFSDDWDGQHRWREIRHLGGVAMVSNGGGLNHTHSPAPMEEMLRALSAAGEDPPDLVLGDHGYAGAAAAAGVDSIGFADCNDPALFVGEAEGLVRVAVPLDDNVAPHLYAPLTAYLLDGWTG